MNCLDYRRTLRAGEGESLRMKAHRLQCTACVALHREQAVVDHTLQAALEVPVPAGFAPRIERALVSRRRRFLAAAAVSALALGAGSYAWVGRGDALAMACIEFVMKEEAKSIMMGAMPRAQAQTALAGILPLERLERIGQVRHIGPCPFNGVVAYHVVLGVPQGKVTLLVMPAARMARGQRASEHGMYSRVLPLPRGSVGIVGADAPLVDSVAGALRV